MGNSSSSTHNDEQLIESLEQGSVSLFLSAVQANRKVVARPIRARNGDTGLHIMCTKGLEDGLRAVLQVVLEVRAAEKGAPLSADEVRKFSAKLCNVTNERGRTPLMAAAKTGHVNCVRILLDNHANVWIRDRAGGATVMHYAAAAGHDAVASALVDYCIQHPAPPSVHAPRNGLVDMPNDNGLTPLHYAVWHKRHRTVALLCELGASLYSMSMWTSGGEAVPCAAGSTPLHVAAVSGSGRCTKALMKAFAALQASQEEETRANGGLPVSEPMIDPRLVQDRQGNLPFAIALQHQHVRLLPYLHPFTPLADMFADERPEDRVVGVPKLTELSALVAQRVLLQQLDAIEAEVAAKAAKTTAEQPPAIDGNDSSTAAASPSTSPSSPVSAATASEPSATAAMAGANAAGPAAADRAPALEAAAGQPTATTAAASLNFSTEASSALAAEVHQPVQAATSNSSGCIAQHHAAGQTPSAVAPLQVPVFDQGDSIQPTHSSISVAADTPASTPATNSATKHAVPQAAAGQIGSTKVGAPLTPAEAAVVEMRPPGLQEQLPSTAVSTGVGNTQQDGGVCGTQKGTGTGGSQQESGAVSEEEAASSSSMTRTSAFAVAQPSWVERQGMWRSKLHEDSSAAARTQGDGHAAAFQQEAGKASMGADLQDGYKALRRACSDSVAPQPVKLEAGNGAAEGHWMARRNAWRETLKRHGRQLLSAAAGTLVPGVALSAGTSHHPATFFASTQTLAELRGLALKADQQVAEQQQQQQQQQNQQQQQGDVQATPDSAQADVHHEAHHHEAHHHVPPNVALNLRLLGLAGSVAQGWPKVDGLEAPHMTDAAAQLPRRTSADGIVWHSDDGRAHRSSRPSQTQLRAAIHMVRMHRLTNGVSDLYTPVHLESDIPEVEEEGEQAGEGSGVGPSSDQLDINMSHPDESSLTPRSRSPEITVTIPAEGTEELTDLLVRTSVAHGPPDVAAAAAEALRPTSPFSMASAQEQQQQQQQQQVSKFISEGGAAEESQDLTSPSLGRARSITNAVLARQWVKQASGGLSTGGAANTAAPAAPNINVQLGPSRKSICVAAVLTGATTGPAGIQLSHSMLRGGSRQPGMLSNANSLTHNSQLLALLSRCSSMSDACSEEVCGVCLDAGTFVNLKGCTHRICVGCAKELVRLHDLKPAFCPFCRHFILGFSLYASPPPPARKHNKSQGVEKI